MVTRAEHQKIVKKLRDMTETKSKIYAELTRAQGKVKKVQTQLEKEKIK
jgi:hypothetical protein